ncbi:MAG: hypothetical protein AAF870_03105, partial [Pseudomonadota bacterium]
MTKTINNEHFRYAKATAVTGSALSLLLFGSSLAMANGADIVNGWISQSQDSDIFSVSVGDVSYNGLTSKTSVQDLQVSISLGAFAQTISKAFGETADADLTDVSYKLVFPDIELTNLQDIGDRYSVDAVRAAEMNFDMDMGAVGGDLPPSEATYEGLSVDDLSWAKLPELANDPSKQISQFLPVLRAIIDFSYDEMKIDKAISSSPITPDGPMMTAEYGPMRLGKTVRGDVSTLDLDWFKMAIPIPLEDGQQEAAITNISSGEITARDYNYGTMLDTLFAPADGSSSDYKTAIGSIALYDMKVSVPSQAVEVNIKSFVFEDMGIRTPTRDFLAELETLAVKERNGEEVDMSEEELIKLI